MYSAFCGLVLYAYWHLISIINLRSGYCCFIILCYRWGNWTQRNCYQRELVKWNCYQLLMVHPIRSRAWTEPREAALRPTMPFATPRAEESPSGGSAHLGVIKALTPHRASSENTSDSSLSTEMGQQRVSWVIIKTVAWYTQSQREESSLKS